MAPVIDGRMRVVWAAVEDAAKSLVSYERVGLSTYVNLPLLYPDGSCVTVKIDQEAGGFKVSDGGFAFREAEAIGFERSFGRIAHRMAEEEGVEADRRVISALATPDELIRAICDVGKASWRIADRVYERLAEADEFEIAEGLRERLSRLFGPDHVRETNTVRGSSSREWEFSAVVDIDHAAAIFHAVSKHPNSIFRTATAFHDIGNLREPMRCVAVVRSKPELGHDLSLLAQAGQIIEAKDSDDRFRRAVV